MVHPTLSVSEVVAARALVPVRRRGVLAEFLVTATSPSRPVYRCIARVVAATSFVPLANVAEGLCDAHMWP